MPPDEKLIMPGCALASAMSSATDFAGTEGCTTRMFAVAATSATGS